MKILHVDTEKGFRGGEQQIVWLSEGLIRKGIHVKVGCLKNNELFKACKEKGIETLPLNGNCLIDCLKIGMEGKRYDIIHAHAAKAHLIASIAKIFNKKPLIYTRRIDYLPHNDPVTKFKYKQCDTVIAVSQAVEDKLKPYLDKRTLLFTIHSAADLDLDKKVSKETLKKIKDKYKDKIIVGTASALTEQKNIPNLLSAAEIILRKKKNVVFLVAGEGNLKEKIKKIIEDRNLQEKFILIGFKKDIQNYLKAFDVFVMSSDNEGISGAMLNAMVLGKAVVSTDAGGAREAIINEETGLLVKKNDPEALAKALLKLIEDKKLRDTLGANAKAFVRENFSVEKMVDLYIKSYKKTLEVKNGISNG